MTRTLVLASSSPYRRELLERLGVSFQTASPAIDETPLPDEKPAATALRLSAQKAKALALRFSDALIIGSDQVASLDNQALGKPGGYAAATEQLKRMSGKTTTFYTALSLYNSKTHHLQQDTVVTHVRLRPLNAKQIDAYLQRDQPWDCAGSARSEGLGIALMESLSGDDPTALIGLPLIALTRMLAAESWDILSSPEG
jgi:septum formation protein